MGNIRSVEKAIKFLGFESRIVSSESDIDGCSHLILPGVGSFGEAVKNLQSKGLFTALQKTKKPLLGICLGMQLLAESSEESPGVKGLGRIKGRVTKLKSKKLPHVGWAKVDTSWLEGYPEDKSYYFVHSYEVTFYHPNMSYAQYGNHYILSHFRIGNLTGCQFHPEKSQKAGLDYLRRWICEE